MTRRTFPGKAALMAAGVVAAAVVAWLLVRRHSLPPSAVHASPVAAIAVIDTPPVPAEAAPPVERIYPAWRSRSGRLLGIGSCLLLLGAALLFQRQALGWGWNLLVLGTVGLSIGLMLHPLRRHSAPAAPPVSERVWWQQAALGVVCIIILIVWNLLGDRTISTFLQLIVLCGGIGLIVVGLGGPLLPLERHTLLWMGLITILALMLRLVALDSAVRFFVDEANFSDGVYFARLHPVPLFARFSSTTPFPWLFPYLQSLTVDLFGRNLIGLRLVSVIIGTLTIPAIYILARALFNQPVALLAALLLATFPPHIHFSRIGINNIADPLFGTLALGWLAWGWQTGRRGYFALAGAALGLTQYFYDGGRLLYPLLLGAWLWCCIELDWLRNDRLRGRFKGVAVMLVAAVVIGGPIYIMLAAQEQTFSLRFNEANAVGMLPALDYLVRALDTFRLYLGVPDDSFFYRGNAPLLLVYLAAPFLIGLATALWYALRLQNSGVLLLLWLLATAIGNSLLFVPLMSARYVVVFPALMLLAALGLHTLFHLLGQRSVQARRLARLVVILMAAGQVIYYFAQHVPLYNIQSRLYADSQDAAFRSTTLPLSTQVYIIAEPVGYHSYAQAVMHFLRDDISTYNLSPSDFDANLLESLPRTDDYAFYLLPNDTASLNLIQLYFAVDGPFRSPYPLPPDREFWLYFVSAAKHVAE